MKIPKMKQLFKSLKTNREIYRKACDMGDIVTVSNYSRFIAEIEDCIAWRKIEFQRRQIEKRRVV